MKALNLTYQRNGVAGEGFYQLVYKNKEQGMKKAMTFVATFDTRRDKENKIDIIDWVKCRVTSIDNPLLAWRGDVLAGEIQRHLFDIYGEPDEDTGGCLYDLIERVNVDNKK